MLKRWNFLKTGFYEGINLETLKEDAKRYGVRVLNPDINLSSEKSVIEEHALRLGLLHVGAVGSVVAETIVRVRTEGGPFNSVGQFMERTGVLHETLDNLADAGAFDSLATDRRGVRWEIGLRYRPVNQQLALSLPVAQDMVSLDALTPLERIQGEYRTMGLHPEGHVMAYLRDLLEDKVATSREIADLEDGSDVTVAGLVIRRQRPSGQAVFITLEDEFGLSPLIIWPAVYQKYRHIFREPLLAVQGTVSKREGTMNVVVAHAKGLSLDIKAPKAKNWG